MRRVVSVSSYFATVLFLLAGVADARQATSSISGTVVDTAGGLVPGAQVTVTSANGTKTEVVTNTAGTFNVPALAAGTYTVSVALQGFKTAVITDIRLLPGVPANVKAVLEVGGLAERVTVSGGSSVLINTTTPTVSSTLNVDQIAQIPTATRDLLLGGVTMLPGVNFTGEARGNATINGLPESFLNITLDGVSNQDNFNKSTDGFFAPVRPRQDAIEAVTVTTAAGGADVGGHGAVSINFVTRSGTNRMTGSAYDYYRDTWMNSNYWFNKNAGLERNDVRLNQYGARLGGPIVLPGLYDGSGKAFFFVHHEELRLPNDATRDRTVLHPRAVDGFFRYQVTSGGQTQIREVNLFGLAGADAPDPTVANVLNNIRQSTQKTGVLSAAADPLQQRYEWLSPAMQTEHQPAIRIDYNLNTKHRLSGTFNKLWQDRNPDQFNELDRQFPDSPNFTHTVARRPSRSLTLRSTLSNAMVSELRVGITVGERIFFGQPEELGPATFADQGGRALTLGLSTNWHRSSNLTGRSAWQYSFDETINWQKGRHALMIGGGVFLGRAWDDAQLQVPGITFGMNTANDPDAGLFTTTNFPDASNNQLGNARQLYALLTGRVASITGQAALDAATNRYQFLGKRRREGKLNNYNLYVQDQWRVRPTVTINAGLRWDLQTPFSPSNDTMSAVTFASMCGISGFGDGSLYQPCQFFTPGASAGVTPEFIQLTSGTNGYNIDWNNVAPNLGIAWRPNVQSGIMRAILGDPELATIRAGYSVAFERQGMGRFTGVYGPNTGSVLTLTRSNANSNLVLPGESWPILLSQTSRLAPAAFPDTPTYPIAVRSGRQDSLNGFRPDIKVASARTWTVGFQRALSRDMAVEIRYVGTRGVDQWSTLNYNERNLIENGFFDEFMRARANLQAHVAAGCTASGANACSFAYRGPGTNTSPLPIYLAYLTGNDDNPNNVASYTGTGWTNTGITGDMSRFNPNPGNAAADLDGDGTFRNNAITAGLARNFFVVNPDVNAVNVSDSGAYSDYHALQLEFRRRLSKGLSFNANYQYAHEGESAFLGFHFGREMNPTANVRHAIKTQWDWTIPVGRGQRYGTNMNALLNGLLGGWQFTGAGRIQARMMNFGNVRLVGMTEDDLQEMYEFRIIDDPANPGRRLVTMLPDDVIQNTRRAFSTSATSPTGYGGLGAPEGRFIAPANSADCVQLKAGDCAPRTLLIRAPFFTRVDIGMTKRFPLRGRMNFELRVDVLNLFDNVNFVPEANPGTGAGIFQVEEGYRDIGNNFDPGGRLGQLSFRFNW